MLIFFIRITWQMIRNRFELLFQVNNDFWYLGFIPEKKIKPKGKSLKKLNPLKENFGLTHSCIYTIIKRICFLRTFH